MKHMCRRFLTPSRRSRQLTWQELFPHARIVTDPTKLALLNAEVANRKQKEEAKLKAQLTSDAGPYDLSRSCHLNVHRENALMPPVMRLRD
ncbi:MAG: hypothetical protein DMG85_07220 [Acidobacteria bacterium]|jgi:hypothetical protein|nr:MAG: hypothetical protein DMG85_07220 [Acidobacteriota bacterium]